MTSAHNPADDVARGKPLLELSASSQWNEGPHILRQTHEHWPIQPPLGTRDETELRKSAFCAHVVTGSDQPSQTQHSTWTDLINAAY